MGRVGVWGNNGMGMSGDPSTSAESGPESGRRNQREQEEASSSSTDGGFSSDSRAHSILVADDPHDEIITNKELVDGSLHAAVFSRAPEEADSAGVVASDKTSKHDTAPPITDGCSREKQQQQQRHAGTKTAGNLLFATSIPRQMHAREGQLLQKTITKEARDKQSSTSSAEHKQPTCATEKSETERLTLKQSQLQQWYSELESRNENGGDAPTTNNANGVPFARSNSASSSSSSQPEYQRSGETPPALLRYREIGIGVGISLPGAINVIPYSGEESGDQSSPSPQEEEEEEESTSSIGTRSILDHHHHHHEGSSAAAPAPYRVTAIPVTDPAIERAAMEAEIINNIMEKAVQVDAVVLPMEEVMDTQDQSTSDCKSRRRRMLLIFVVMICLVGLLLLPVGLTKERTTNDKNEEEERINDHDPLHYQSILERVRQRGVVRCGVQKNFPGLSNLNPDTGLMEGFNVDQCRAISIVVFGNANQYELYFPTKPERLPMLANGTIDVIANIVAWRIGPDVYSPELESGSGLCFSTPYIFSGFTFAGQPAYVKCADQLDSWSPECRALTLCVTKGTVLHDTMLRLLPGAIVVPCTSGLDLTQKFSTGQCNVVAVLQEAAPEQRFRQAGYTGEFTVGNSFYSREDIALATLDNQPEWSRIIQTVVHTFLVAEANNITQINAHAIQDLFHGDNDYNPNDNNNSSSPTLASIMEALVSTFGNFGDLYAKHYEPLIPRHGLNLLYNNHHHDGYHNNNHTRPGLLYSLPFQELEDQGPEPLPNSTLMNILNRGYLNCGVLESHHKELDIEFCRAVGAAIFAGDSSLVKLIDLSTVEANSIKMAPYFMALENNTVDLVAGVPMTLQVMLGEPPYDASYYSFSQPYFYDDTTTTSQEATNKMEAFAILSRADDSQWNSFIQYVIMATIYAEEQSITQNLWPQLPVTNLFGQGLKQCFRDTVYAVGNYGEIYNRTLQSVIPRSGGNLLNQDLNSSGFGPQHFALPIY